MTTEEIAKKVVELTRRQAWREAVDQLYADDVVSVEAFSAGGGPTETRGIKGIHGKVDWWVGTMQVNDLKVSGPFVAHDRFVVQYDMDVTEKESGRRIQMSEVGVYTVKDGKIAREEFMPAVSS
jgi:hypothetical protein